MGEYFGENLKEARLRVGYSPEKACALVGVMETVWEGWENGTIEPSAGQLREISRHLNASADTLLGLTQSGIPEPCLVDSKWYHMWMDDKKGIIETMAKNMAADLECGYSYWGRSIQDQKRELEEYQKAFEDQLGAFFSMTDTEVNRWCYFDLLRRGTISR